MHNPCCISLNMQMRKFPQVMSPKRLSLLLPREYSWKLEGAHFATTQSWEIDECNIFLKLSKLYKPSRPEFRELCKSGNVFGYVWWHPLLSLTLGISWSFLTYRVQRHIVADCNPMFTYSSYIISCLHFRFWCCNSSILWQLFHPFIKA